MQFTSLSFFAVLAAFAAANPVAEPQTPEQSTAAEQQIISYTDALTADPNVMSVVSALATDVSAMVAVASWVGSLRSAVAAHHTLAPDFLNGLPSQVRPIATSIYNAEISILTANGFTNDFPTLAATGTGCAKATSGTSTGGAAPTGALTAAGVLAAGFVGAIIAL